MKRILLFFIALSMILGWTSCHADYEAFVGTWGVDRIDYYNIDYAGEPIAATIQTYYFTPGDPDNGIDLIFRNDRTGEMRDRSRDTVYITVYNENNVAIDTIVHPCPDTTVVTSFTYSYHDDDALLYMNMEALMRFYQRKTVNDTPQDNFVEIERRYTYQMHIEMLTDDSFIYVNEYDKDYVEKARLIRTSNKPAAKATRSSKSSSRPVRCGSLLSNH